MGRDILVELNDKIDKTNEAIDNVNIFFEKVNNFFYTVAHPIVIWDWCMYRISFVAVFACIICLIFYAATNNQKSIKAIRFIAVTFILLKIMDMAI